MWMHPIAFTSTVIVTFLAYLLVTPPNTSFLILVISPAVLIVFHRPKGFDRVLYEPVMSS